jgi:hypothetical protein
MTHTDYAEGLRQVAAFLERHPEIELPESTLSCLPALQQGSSGGYGSGIG